MEKISESVFAGMSDMEISSLEATVPVHDRFLLWDEATRRRAMAQRLRDLGLLVPDSAFAPAWVEGVRRTQAFVLWNKGFGTHLGHIAFDDFLAREPRIDAELIPDHPTFPHLVLVDARLPSVRAICLLAGIRYDPDDSSFDTMFIPYDAMVERRGIYWMRCQDGRRYDGWSMQEARTLFADDEVGASLEEGIFMHLQGLDLFGGDHAVDLPGSILVNAAHFSPGLVGIGKGGACVAYGKDTEPVFKTGSASRWNP